MEETFLFEAFRIRYAGPDDIPLFFGEVILELTTELDGFTVTDRESDDLFSYPGVLTDARTGIEFEAFSATVAAISFNDDGQQRTSFYAFVDVQSPIDDTLDQSLAVRIRGAELPDFQIGEDLLNFLQLNNGGLLFEPPGFQSGDFVEFSEVAGQIDALPPPPQDPTGLNFQEVLDIAFLYGAAFDRKPDVEGVNFWIDRVDDGDRTFVEVAERFTTEDEFVGLYGGLASELDPRDYVRLLYDNTLNREFDLGGFNFWVRRLEDGLSPEELLIRFSASEEYRENNPEIGSIFEVSPGTWDFLL
ncbi:MAG: DUF4214 domain-containing protein [Pseudomonadota bacterium]